MVEAMMALVLVDHVLLQHAQCNLPLSEESSVRMDPPNPLGKTARREDWDPSKAAATAPVGAAQSLRVDEE